MGLIGTIICSASKSYGTLRAGRVVQGFSFSAYESLIFSTVADLFFVHERGVFISFFGFSLAAVSNLTSVVCGPITNTLGWHYLFHILDALLGFQLLLVFFLVPETAYERDVGLEIDQTADDSILEKTGKLQVENIETTERTGATQTRSSSNAGVPAKKSYWQSLAIFTGTHSNENLLPLILAPIMVNLNLGALWMVVVTGLLSSFYVSQSFVAAQIFAFPPYLLSAAGVGYLFLGPFIGALLGSIILAIIMDPLIIWCTKRNRGVYEPEFRLIPVVLGLIGGVGVVAYAHVLQVRGSMYTASFIWGLGLFGKTPKIIGKHWHRKLTTLFPGMIFILTPANSYVVDAFRDLSSEMFISNMMFKNFLFFGYSYFVNNWTATAGPGEVFYVWGGLTFALALTTIPLYIFGKRYRSYWCRNNILEKIGMRTHAEL